MSATYKFDWTRWTLRGKSDLMSVTAMRSMTTLAYERMAAAVWTEAEGKTSDLPIHHYSQSGFKDGYDAAKYCGDYAGGKQISYACAACYSIQIPSDALAGTKAKIEAIAATVYGDRWLAEGAVLSAFLSASATPPDWAAIIETASPTYLASSLDPAPAEDAVTTPDWGAPLRRLTRDNATADQSYAATITPTAAADSLLYLHVVIRLSDYINVQLVPVYVKDPTTDDWVVVPGEFKDSAWVEGGAKIDGASLAVTFDRAVSDVPPPPDAQLVDSDHDGWSDIAEYYAGTHPGDSRDAPATTLNLVCDYPGSVAGGQIVVHAFSNSAMIGRPDAIYHIPMSSWTVEGTTRFLASLETSAPVEGRLREGDVWFFAFIDTGSTGVYNVAMPACVATYGRTSISWGHNIVRFIFSDEAFGYARLQWASTPPTGILVSITRPGDPSPVTCFKKRILGRNYIHEGDFLFIPESSEYAGVRAGLPMYDYESTYTATIGEDAQTFTHLWYEAPTSRISPYVDPEANDVAVKNRDLVVRWVGDIRSCGFAIRVERSVGDVWVDALIRYAYGVQPYAKSGILGQFEIVVNFSDNGSRIDFEDGTYRASVCNLVNQAGVAPTTITGVVGGGGKKGSASWQNSTSPGIVNPSSGGTSSFGAHSIAGGGPGGWIALGSYVGSGIVRPDASSNYDLSRGYNSGGSGGKIPYRSSPTTSGILDSVQGSHNQNGNSGGSCVVTLSIPASIGISGPGCGAGGGGSGTNGNNCGSFANGSGGGKGVHVVFGSIDSWFGCGGGGAGATNGGNGRRLSVPDATTGMGGAGAGVAAGYTTPGLDGYGDGGGGGTLSTAGRGGTGCVHVLEHLAESDNLVSFVNDNADKTTSKSFTYTPTEGTLTIDLLIVGGGGSGGFMAMHSDAVSTWGAKYCGGGGAGGGVLVILGLSITNTAISTGWTTPVEISIDTTDGTTADGPFSVGGTITSTFAEPEQLTLVLFRKLGITTDSAGNVREGFGGLPAAIQTVLSDAGSFTIRGIEPGYYVLLATVAGTGWQDGFWHSFPDGRPKTIHVTGSITNADIVVG